MHIFRSESALLHIKGTKNKMHIIISIGPVCSELSVQKDYSEMVMGALNKIHHIKAVLHFQPVPPAYKKYDANPAPSVFLDI